MALEKYTFRLGADVIRRIKNDAERLGTEHTTHTRNLVHAALTRDDGAELHRLRIKVDDLETQIHKLTVSFIDGIEAVLFNLAVGQDERMTIADATSQVDEFRRRLTEE